MYYIGIITGMAALNHVGWLSYVRQLYETLEPTWVNFILGMVSSCIDNNLLEAAGVMAISIDKSYTFATHLRFLPAVPANFLVSFGLWYLQFEVLHWI